MEIGGRDIQVVTWRDIKHEISQPNAELASIIEEINPSDRCKLIVVSYKYGDDIIKNGQLQLPFQDGQLVSTAQSSLPEWIKNQLGYQAIPLFMSLDKDNEIFFDTGFRIIPLNLVHKGSLMGVFEALDYVFQNQTTSKWCVSAGSRSIFMLPKITDNLGLDRLRLRYEIPGTVKLQDLQDHWTMFKLMAQHPTFEQKWENRIVFFTKDWLTNKDSTKWLKFKNYLYQQGWKQAKFSIGKVECSLQWTRFAEAISKRNLKPRPYLIDQTKHILFIAAAKSPAIRPIFENQESAPTQGIQEAFLNTYSLKEYIPSLMHICPLYSLEKSFPVYYSLSYPTILEGSPSDKSTSTIMLDLRKIKLLIETLQKSVEGDFSYVNNLIHRVELDYFHVGEDQNKELKQSNSIIHIDPAFEKEKQSFVSRKLCETSTFWKGCIRIKFKTPS